MPMPDEIKQALEKHATFDPSLEKADYQEKKDLYQLYLDLLEPDGHKIADMILPHGTNEDAGKLQTRKDLSVAFNLVPTLVGMLVNYIFSDEPSIDVGDDPDLTEFLRDCDGSGTSFVQWCRQTAFPLSIIMGHVDGLVQNPLVVGDIRNAADLTDTKIGPKLVAITPLDRINWESTLAGDYQWICFTDAGNGNHFPFFRNLKIPVSYVTVSRAVTFVNDGQAGEPGGEKGLWVRSWRPWFVNTNGEPVNYASPGQYVAPTPEKDPERSGQFVHEADYTPTQRVPIAKLYWQKSNDPKNRATGVSKISMIALLTKKIIQILSWIDEDMLSWLSLLMIPTQKGQEPKNDDGSSQFKGISAFTTIFFDRESRHTPGFLKGDPAIIKTKLELIETLVLEILRLSHLTFGAQARSERVTSGVQAVVQRNELFRELQDAAGNLDRFALETLALVKSWATGEDWSVQRLIDSGVTVSFNKGPYAADSAADAIEQATAIINMFRRVSPKLCEMAYKKTAQAYGSTDDRELPDVLEEIEANTGAVLDEEGEAGVLAEAAAIAEGKMGGTINVQEQIAQPEGEAVDGSQSANKPGDAKPDAPKAAA